MHVTAIVVAAGSGVRMGSQEPKQYLTVHGHPVLWWTVRAFQECDSVDSIVLVADEGHPVVAHTKASFAKISAVVPGGRERQDSVRAGLGALPAAAEIVLVHDGARCLISQGVIERVVEAAKLHGAAIAAVPLEDTVKRVDEDGLVAETPDRKMLFRVQTPQGFRASILVQAYQNAPAGETFTDDSSVVERSGARVHVVPGSTDNIKITTPVDLVLAGLLLERREVP